VKQPTLYLMMGLPGAGKTTAAKVIESLTGAIRLSSDEQRLKLWPEPAFSEEEHQKLYDYLDKKTELLLKEGKSVIYDANLNRKIHRQQKYDIVQRTDARCVLCLIKTDEQLAYQRAVIEADGQETRVFGNLDAPVFNRLKDEIEWPHGESYVELDGTKITPEYVTEILQLNEAA
jgi:predicted kinase